MPYPKVNQGLVLNEAYWKGVYGDGYDVDGDYNARLHAKYIHSLFQLMESKIQSLGDFGFGKASLLREFVKIFKPARVVALEPSPERVEDLRKKSWVSTTHIQIFNTTLQEFDPPYLRHAPLDLAICNSVLQYIPDKELKDVVAKMAQLSRFLYFTVPTKNDYIRMKKEIAFEDPYAFVRNLKFYRKLMSEHYHYVSYNLLESKFFPATVFHEEFFKF
ncbi:class I SAM-dependent methyltransferase [Leptospira sp. GIMC2001]|uniref:class I SAM-dependent methyltransferase n=1 Tax=Leptospira sp. GIMC2001 TaxID=1513297 RepID=UPI002349FCB2|nr:class I SAM-dependent methyltransferase [Leptospira sp. GIMC2001]WCL47543.1 class I SAM-dependent methyltransferase [Leptospira sp. GIMC2001]